MKVDNANSDGVGNGPLAYCLNGMQATECTTSSGAADDVIYWRDADDVNTIYLSTTKCVPLESTTVDNPVNPTTTETSQMLQSMSTLTAAVNSHHESTKCITGGDVNAKGGVKSLYQSLGFCPPA